MRTWARMRLSDWGVVKACMSSQNLCMHACVCLGLLVFCHSLGHYECAPFPGSAGVSAQKIQRGSEASGTYPEVSSGLTLGT